MATRTAIVLVLGLLLGGVPILPGIIPPAKNVFAQDETIYLAPGQSRKVEAYLPQMGTTTYTIEVRRQGGGDMGGLKIYARARKVSGPDCNADPYDAGLYVTTAGDTDERLEEGTWFYTGDGWSEWVGGTIPAGFGYDWVQVGVYGFPFPDCPNDPATFEVEICLEADETPTPTIEFWADRDHILRGECTTLRWDVGGVNTVHYQGDGVPGEGYRQECPQQTTTYELCVKTYEGERICQQVTVYVEEPTVPSPTIAPTSSPPPTTVPTPMPRTPTTTPAPRTPTATPTPRTPTTTPTPRTPTYTPTPRTPTPIPTSTPPPCPDRFEPNDDPQTPWQVSPGTYQSYICTPYDHDWFSVVLDETTDLQVTLTDLPADFQLMMGPQHGVPMKGSYNEGRADEHLTFEDAEPGVYLIHIFGGPGHRPVEERGYSDQEPYTLIIRVGEPPIPEPEIKLLVVTHSGALNHYVDRGDTWSQVRQWLDERYGPEGYDVVDLAEGFPNQVPDQRQVDQEIQKQWPRAQYWAVFIIGGHNVIPFALGNTPVPDGDYLWTDDLYADFTGDWVPDMPLARLPDVGDFSLLQTQLTGISGPTAGGGFVMANEEFTYADYFAAAAGTQAIYSPPFDHSHIAGMNSAFAYFDLGSLHPLHPQFNRVWFGCSYAFGADGNCGLVALAAEDANTQGVVVSAVSYAGFVGDCDGPGCWNLRGRMPHQFLANGAQAYIGTLVRNYLYGEPVYIEVGGESTLTEYDYSEIRMGIPLFTKRFIDHWGNTSDPLAAFYLAKVDMLRAGYGMAASPHASVEQKMGHGLVYYGVPGAAVDCPACLSQTTKSVFPDTLASPEVAINVRRPLDVLEVIDPSAREVRETGATLTQGCGFLDCNSATRDSDDDGLSDALEWRLSYEFDPFLEFDEQEITNPWSSHEFDIYHQVSPESGTRGAGTILLTYIFAYDQDYGSVNWGWMPEWGKTVFEAHSGDTEKVWVRLRYEFEEPVLWVWMDGFEIKRHGLDPPEAYPPVSGGGPYLYISRDKHAAYTDLVDCATYTYATVEFEECGDGPRGWASDFTGYLHANHNVGEAQLEDLEEGEPYNGTRHWQEYTYAFNGFPLWDMEEPFCGNLLNCAAVWEWTPVKWYRSIPYIGEYIVEPIAGRFLDKGSGPFGPYWHRVPAPIAPPFHSLEPRQ